MDRLIDTWDEKKKLRVLVRYNNGDAVKDITNALNCGMKTIYRLLNELEKQGHVVEWRRYDTGRLRKKGDSSRVTEA
jgi:transposase